MIFSLFKKKDDLPARCAAYLENGPPASMTTYMPGSLVEIIIGHGAQGQPLDLELMDVALIVLTEAEEIDDYENEDVRRYMHQGFSLVGEILDRQ